MDMDRALGQAAEDHHSPRWLHLSNEFVKKEKEKKAGEEFKLKWDRSKEWKNQVHLGVNFDRKNHWKFREGKANAAVQLIRRLTRLPPTEKKKIVASQLIAILTYGAERHSKPIEKGKLLAAEWNRFVTAVGEGVAGNS